MQYVLGNLVAEINQLLSIFCLPRCRRDASYWMSEEQKSLELDVYGKVQSVTSPRATGVLRVTSAIQPVLQLGPLPFL